MTTFMDPTLRGSGKITGVFFSAEQDVVAVASEFALLANPRARAAYGGRALRYRVALYRRGALAPFAAFDDLRLPVNDVAFHPDGTMLAIGAGIYDGGFLFEGDLIVWDWRHAHTSRPFKHVPEVVRCRYNVAGNQVEAWVRPWDEEWGPPSDDPDAAFDTLYIVHATVPDTSSADFHPTDLELDPTHIAPRDEPPADLRTPETRLMEWFGISHWTSRGAIKDVAWLDEDRFAVAHEGCLLEIYHRNGDRIAA